jgi:hypothetical protein
MEKHVFPVIGALPLVDITNTESKQVTHQSQKSLENNQNNEPENTLNEIEISTILFRYLCTGWSSKDDTSYRVQARSEH